MLYRRLQVQTRHNFSYTVQVTPSYLVRSCEQEWDQTLCEKNGLITDTPQNKFYVRCKQGTKHKEAQLRYL